MKTVRGVIWGVFLAAVALLAAAPGAALSAEAGEEIGFAGVGLEIAEAGGVVTVIRTVEGAPGAKAGIRAGDTILAVDGRPTKGASVGEVAGWIRGRENEPVVLSVKRPDRAQARDITLVREMLTAGPQGIKASSPLPAPMSVEETIDRILKEK